MRFNNLQILGTSMNIDKLYRYSLSIIWVALLYLASVSAQAANIIIIPPNPVVTDRIFVAVYGGWNDGCVPRDAQATFSENVIHIDFPPKPAEVYCTASMTNWAEMVQVPTLAQQLPEGTYDVIVTRGEIELGRHSFMVQKGLNDETASTDDTVGGLTTAINPRRVICKNLTSRKKKIIKNLTNSWNCEAAGLKVRPGDKIEQTVIGIVNEKP
jgi:hypothetical protein